MKLATFTHENQTVLGIVEGDEIADLSTADTDLPRDLVTLLHAGAAALGAVRRALPRARRFPLAKVRLEAPVQSPRKFLGLGLSFKSHVAELRERKIPIAIPPHQVDRKSTCLNSSHIPLSRMPSSA